MQDLGLLQDQFPGVFLYLAIFSPGSNIHILQIISSIVQPALSFLSNGTLFISEMFLNTFFTIMAT
jgi:hypothetical protein